MSYLILQNGVPNFQKAVISLWFIAPKESIENVADHGSSSGLLRGILPLMTFGPVFDGYSVNVRALPQANYSASSYTYSGAGYLFLTSTSLSYSPGAEYVKGDTFQCNPSFIGIACSRDDNTGELLAELRIRIQMADYGSGSWTDLITRYHPSNYKALISGGSLPGVATDTAWKTSPPMCLTDGVVPGGTWHQDHSSVDYTELQRQKDGPDAFEAGHGIRVVPDQWHHLLLSFDLTSSTKAEGGTVFDDYGECSPTPTRTTNYIKKITNPCQMWLALDDVNYTNSEAENASDGDFPLRVDYQTHIKGLGKNDIATSNHYHTTFAVNGGLYRKTWFLTGLVSQFSIPVDYGMPTYSYEPHDVPSNEQQLGFPCVPASVGHEYHHVEMAEFQMFTGVTIDTGDVTNRRAFIAPISDGDLEPVSPIVAEEFLRKRPEILLHGSTNWIKGKNTGSLGLQRVENQPDVILPSGQFTPTGLIIRYKPDPFIPG